MICHHLIVDGALDTKVLLWVAAACVSGMETVSERLESSVFGVEIRYIAFAQRRAVL